MSGESYFEPEDSAGHRLSRAEIETLLDKGFQESLQDKAYRLQNKILYDIELIGRLVTHPIQFSRDLSSFVDEQLPNNWSPNTKTLAKVGATALGASLMTAGFLITRRLTRQD